MNSRHYTKSMCELCGANILKSSMRDHLRTHGTALPYVCHYEGCKKAFKVKNGLHLHLQGVHNEGKLHTCQYCGKTYKLQATMVVHIRLKHTFDRCVKCDQCPMWYLNEKELQAHVNQKHLGLKPYPCNLCGSSQKSQGKMFLHMRRLHPEEYKVLFESGKFRCRKKEEIRKRKS